MPRLRHVQQTDFSGGLNLVSQPYKLKPTQVYRVRNLLLEQHGALVTRDGYSISSVSPILTWPIIHRGYLNSSVPLPTGHTYPYAVINDIDANDTKLYLTDTTPWTLVGTFPDANAQARIPQSSTMLDTEVFALGNFITPYVFDGTTIVPITAEPGQTRPPAAAHCIYHLGALWLWNTSAATTDLDGPSSLRQSDINNYNSWPNIFQTFVGKNDGQTGQGLASFTIAETGISPTQTLVLFKNFSTYQVTGTFGASNFGVQKVKSDMGCIAPRTIQFVSGFGVIRLTHKGFAVFNGVDDQIISEEIRPLIFGDPDGIYGNPGPAIDFESVTASYAAQSGEPPMYIAMCPVIGSGGQCTRFFIYDLVRKAWTICDFPLNFSWLGTLYQAGIQPLMQAGGYVFPGDPSEEVKLYNLFNHDIDDNGTPVEWSVTTRPFFLGGTLMDTDYYRRGIMAASIRTAPNTMELVITFNDSTPAIEQIRTVTFDNTGDQRVDWNMLKLASGIYKIQISGEDIISLRGLSIQGTQRPLSSSKVV